MVHFMKPVTCVEERSPMPSPQSDAPIWVAPLVHRANTPTRLFGLAYAVSLLAITALAQTPRPIVSGGTYRLFPAHDTTETKVLQVSGSNATIGTAMPPNINASSGDITSGQIWVITSVGTNTWRISPSNSISYALNAPNANNGVNLTVAAWANNQNQKWISTANSDGTYTFTSVLGDTPPMRHVLDVERGLTVNGTPVQLYTSNGSNNQKWKLVREAGTYKPDASSTGYLGSLTVENGHGGIFNPKSNTLYQNKDFRCLVVVDTADVKFRNCRFSGPASAAPSNSALLFVTQTGPTPTLVEDCTFFPQTPTHTLDAVRGRNFTLRRCNISGTTDGIHLYGPGGAPFPDLQVLVETSYIHELVFWGPHIPGVGHSDGTHNDSVQIAQGYNATFRGNWMNGLLHQGLGDWGSYNKTSPANQATSVFMITPSRGPISGLTITHNWLGGGKATINQSNKPGYTITNIGSIVYNKFSHDQGLQGSGYNDTAAIIRTGSAAATNFNNGNGQPSNVYEDNGVALKIRVWN
ncbi:MAG: RICIN domain-containing protein [Opitutaceae bacterium]|nr:RICIN domain-containing protein [Opitutaceae bacterium]